MSYNSDYIKDTDGIIADAKGEIDFKKDYKELEEFRIKYLGKKGIIQARYEWLAKAPKEDKREIGRLTNWLKVEITKEYENRKKVLDVEAKQAAKKVLDVTMPGIAAGKGPLPGSARAHAREGRPT